MQARQSILEMWQATMAYSYTMQDTWTWGGRRPPNCISDAEQLLILLYPATTISSLALENTDQIGEDAGRALRLMGSGPAIPRTIIRATREYLLRYRDDQGNPTFAGGSYFKEDDEAGATAALREELDVVDAYSMSLTLCLAVLGFTKVFRSSSAARGTVLAEISETETLASARLSAAMVGLLRSFVVHTFAPDSEPGRELLMIANQSRTSPEAAVRSLNRELDEVWVNMREELAEGLGESQRRELDEFDSSGGLFECGWSWGVVDGSPIVPWAGAEVPLQPEGIAAPRPSTYFTVSAMDGIRDLDSDRTRVLGLLTLEQQRLARALQNRLNVTQRYWARLATAGNGQWPLEDLPWRTTDGSESDYHSLLLSAIVIQGLSNERGSGPELTRVARLLEELARRAKITRRTVANDPAVALHVPGLTLELQGSQKAGGEPLGWEVSSFSMLLLKQMVQVAALIEDSVQRTALLRQADQTWEHLLERRLGSGPGHELWDATSRVFPVPGPAPSPGPSWYHTERVMEALVQAALTVRTEVLPGAGLSSLALETLAEAENRLDRELLRGQHDQNRTLLADLRAVQADLRRSRQLVALNPATSIALANRGLLALDELAAARSQA